MRYERNQKNSSASFFPLSPLPLPPPTFFFFFLSFLPLEKSYSEMEAKFFIQFVEKAGLRASPSFSLLFLPPSKPFSFPSLKKKAKKNL